VALSSCPPLRSDGLAIAVPSPRTKASEPTRGDRAGTLGGKTAPCQRPSGRFAGQSPNPRTRSITHPNRADYQMLMKSRACGSLRIFARVKVDGEYRAFDDAEYVIALAQYRQAARDEGFQRCHRRSVRSRILVGQTAAQRVAHRQRHQHYRDLVRPRDRACPESRRHQPRRRGLRPESPRANREHQQLKRA
jgi:hypothetical protein